MNKDLEKTKGWYNNDYTTQGFKAQRLFPNEELLRFMGRNYFSIEYEKRKAIKMLEVGCGSCANLWMIAKEGFDAHGIDISEEAISLGEKRLMHWNTQANLSVSSMTSLSFENNYFDVVFDVFSSYCLNADDFMKFIQEANRVLKKDGKLFIYTPSVHSDAYTNHAPAIKIDEFTLNGIYRKDSPFYGNFYLFRFESPEKLKNLLEENGFKVNYMETITRTYNNMQEKFQHISLEAVKR